MDISLQNWVTYWVLFAIMLSASEILLPGLISIFLGIAAFVVAGGIWLGWINDIITMMLWWVVVSCILLVTLRNLVAKLAPGEQQKDDIDDDSVAIGSQVLVVEDVDTLSGRVEYRGSTWDAKVEKGFIPSGSYAKIKKRDGLFWIVSPIS